MIMIITKKLFQRALASSLLVRSAAFRSSLLASASDFPRQPQAAFSRRSKVQPTVLAMTGYPVPRREEDRVFYAGAPPPDWDLAIPRQSEESSENLLDPPVAVSDPYGWMRDMKRENPEILDHLKAENEYTQSTIAHLEPLQKQLYDEFLSTIQEVRMQEMKKATWSPLQL